MRNFSCSTVIKQLYKTQKLHVVLLAPETRKKNGSCRDSNAGPLANCTQVCPKRESYHLIKVSAIILCVEQEKPNLDHKTVI